MARPRRLIITRERTLPERCAERKELIATVRTAASVHVRVT